MHSESTSIIIRYVFKYVTNASASWYKMCSDEICDRRSLRLSPTFQIQQCISTWVTSNYLFLIRFTSFFHAIFIFLHRDWSLYWSPMVIGSLCCDWNFPIIACGTILPVNGALSRIPESRCSTSIHYLQYKSTQTTGKKEWDSKNH